MRQVFITCKQERFIELINLLAVFSLLAILLLPTLHVSQVCAAGIFSDGFESGNFSAWTRTDNSPLTVTAPTHSGNYAAYISGSTDAYETFGSAHAQCYARCYVYFTVLPWAQPYSSQVIALYSSSNSYFSLTAEAVNVDGANCSFRLRDAWGSSATGTTIIQLDTWYCIEIFRNVGGTPGGIMYINGIQEAIVTGAYVFNTDTVQIGGNWQLNSTGYIDDVVVSPTYIGPESSDIIGPTFDVKNPNTIVAGASCTFACLINDNVNVSSSIFSTNNTSSWTNSTINLFSSFFNTTAAWANATETLNGTVGNVVGYMWYANDTSNNWSSSDQYNLTLRETPSLQITSDNVTCRKYPETFSVQINVTNAVDVQAFNLIIYYDPSLLNCSSVTSGELANPFTVTFNRANGILIGNMAGSPLTGNHWLLNITFQAAESLIWKEGLTNKLESKIWFYQAEIEFSDNSTLQYVESGVNQINVNQVTYTFLPIQGDVNNDGTVNIQDIRTIAAYYGITPADSHWPAASRFDLNQDNEIDIYDLIVVASNFGFTYP